MCLIYGFTKPFSTYTFFTLELLNFVYDNVAFFCLKFFVIRFLTTIDFQNRKNYTSNNLGTKKRFSSFSSLTIARVANHIFYTMHKDLCTDTGFIRISPWIKVLMESFDIEKGKGEEKIGIQIRKTLSLFMRFFFMLERFVFNCCSLLWLVWYGLKCGDGLQIFSGIGLKIIYMHCSIVNLFILLLRFIDFWNSCLDSILVEFFSIFSNIFWKFVKN